MKNNMRRRFLRTFVANKTIMTKITADLRVTERVMLTEKHALLTLSSPDMPVCKPGQFVNVRVANSPATFLRRPVSIHFYDGKDSIQLLVHEVGEGTHRLCQAEVGTMLDCLLPLGNGFSLPNNPQRTLLVGGGVGVAPLLHLGCELREQGSEVTFILGGKTETDILRREAFEQFGRVCLTTEDGTAGTQGFVTQHAAIREHYDRIYTCGPKPMMQAVAHIAHELDTPCEASLENMMACGLGACLCCVEDTVDGHVCVCKEGPVINTRRLKW